MSIKIIIPKCLARNLNENIVIEVPNSLIQTTGYLIIKRQGKKLIAQQLPDYWGHDVFSARNSPQILFTDCESFNSGIPNYRENEGSHRFYNPAKTFSRNAAWNSYGRGVTDQTYSRGESSTFRTVKPGDLRRTEHSKKSSHLTSEGNYHCPLESDVDSSMFHSNASYRNFPSGLPSCCRESPKDCTFSRTQTTNTTRNATPNKPFTPLNQTVSRGIGHLKSSGFHDANQTFSRSSGRQGCSRYRHSNKSYDARLHPCASRCEKSRFTLEDSSMDITPDVARSPTYDQSAYPPGTATQLPLNRIMTRPNSQTIAAHRTVPRMGNQTFLVNPPRSLRASYQTSASGTPKIGRSRPGHDTFSRSDNRNRLKEYCSAGCGLYDSINKDTSISYLSPDQFYEEKSLPYDSSIQRTSSSLQDSSDDMIFAFGRPLSMSQEGKYNVIKHMSELFPEESKVNECECTPKPFESVGAYTSSAV